MDSASPRRIESDLGLTRYRLIREIGCGAMGMVYEAEHVELGRRVAVKVLHPSQRGDARAKARFVREGRVASHLRHPHVIEVWDSGTCDAGPFLVMEYVEGPTLAAHLRAGGALSLPSAMELVLPIVSALAHAHAAGVVHRDVKPANVLLALDRHGDPFPKIGDFGIGKWLDESREPAALTQDGLVGSLPYMAPEQVREASAVDGRADQYSLAVLLYEAVAGRLPFEAAGSFALMEAICEGRSLPLTDVAPSVPPAFARVVARAMSARAEERYPALDVFGRDLLRFASGRTWAAWAREFSAGDAHEAGGTLGDDPSLATVARGASVPPSSRHAAAWRGLFVPAACVGIGALSTAVALRAQPSPKAVACPEAPLASPASAAQLLEPQPPPSASRPPSPAAVASPIAVLAGGSSAGFVCGPLPPSRPSIATVRAHAVAGRPAALSGSTASARPAVGANDAPILE
jgi:serine/threonine-protein kinase